jgi:hypothetical protein
MFRRGLVGRRAAVLVVVAALGVPAFFAGAAVAHNVSSGQSVFRSINSQFGTFCAVDEAWVLHPGIYGLTYSSWAKTYDRTGLFCGTGYGPPAGQIYVQQVLYQTYQGVLYQCGNAAAYNAAGSSEAAVAIAPCNFGNASHVVANSVHAIWWNSTWNPQGSINVNHS